MGRVGEVVGDGATRGIRVDTGEVAMMSVGLLKDAMSALTNDRGFLVSNRPLLQPGYRRS